MRIDVINLEKTQAKTYWIELDQVNDQTLESLKNLVRDPVDEKILFEETSFPGSCVVEISYKPGVTDNSAKALKKIIQETLEIENVKVATGTLFFFDQTPVNIKDLYNPLIQRASTYPAHQCLDYIPSPNFPDVILKSKPIQYFDMEELSEEDLLELSRKNVWAFSPEEITHLRNYFLDPNTISAREGMGLSSLVSDIEIEVLAQTWSEHCKHKIFNAEIEYTEETEDLGSFKVKSIFSSHIKDVTEKINKPWLVSVFKDNAGIVRFGNKNDYCLKVETHNSPSALDPYGGALTGILGVNRDILGCGQGALPIANTNVLCFGSQRYTPDILKQLPSKLKSPEVIMRGVHKGIEDGGNKSGVPTVNGAITFHDNYAGKPLVYCGTVGVLPQTIKGQPTSQKRQEPGDFIVVCGGSVGADGIHGATFSSMELDDNSPSTAVQIGDPFTQKKLTDFLILARDQSLFRGITDNGAGGLSSSIGEMAEETNGAYIDIDRVPLKYPGLSPFEIVVSESQERMSFAVAPETLSDFIELAKKMDVNPAVIGQFHNNGYFEIKQGDKLLASLPLHFMHESLPAMKLKAHYEGEKPEECWYSTHQTPPPLSITDKILFALSHENIASKEKWVRQFDHEVKAATVTKPFVSKKEAGPNNGSVLNMQVYGDHGGISVGCGIAPHFSHLDTYFMTQMAIDEAVRNLISVGTNPDFIALCDNYCWPDPIEAENNPGGSHKLAQLVRSTMALKETALIYQTPFISGKDSMKNDFKGEDQQGRDCKISVPPTLLVTGIGKVDDLNDCLTSDFKQAGDTIIYIGPQDFTTCYKSTVHPAQKNLPPFEAKKNWDIHLKIAECNKKKLLNSCHDLSEGGMITAIIEACLPEQLGIMLEELVLEGEELDAVLFNELPAGYIISTSNPTDLIQLLNIPYRVLGKTVADPYVYHSEFKLSLSQCTQAWSQS